MASQRDIRRRIGAVKNIKQITRAMQFVAASKLKRAQDATLASARGQARGQSGANTVAANAQTVCRSRCAVRAQYAIRARCTVHQNSTVRPMLGRKGNCDVA